MRDIDRMMDFFYGYLIFKAYIFKLRFQDNNGNREYSEMWKKFFSKIDFGKLLDKATKFMKKEIDGKILDLADIMDKASYYALIHPNHPNITLGFVKDADLWNLLLEYGIYKYVREKIADILRIDRGDKIIDFGCGSVSPCFYADIIGEYGIYSGMDYSKPMLRIAEKLCKSKGIFDRVNLVQGYAESKQKFKREFDLAVMSSIMEYSETKGLLRNAMEALKYEGKIAIFSELFRDIEPEREYLFNLYYSLIPNFKRFPSVKEITQILDNSGVSFSIDKYGKHIVVIELAKG